MSTGDELIEKPEHELREQVRKLKEEVGVADWYYGAERFHTDHLRERITELQAACTREVEKRREAEQRAQVAGECFSQLDAAIAEIRKLHEYIRSLDRLGKCRCEWCHGGDS